MRGRTGETQPGRLDHTLADVEHSSDSDNSKVGRTLVQLRVRAGTGWSKPNTDDDLIGLQIDGEHIAEEVGGLDNPLPVRPRHANVGIDRKQRGRIVRRWVRMRETAPERAPIANLPVAPISAAVSAMTGQRSESSDDVVTS